MPRKKTIEDLLDESLTKEINALVKKLKIESKKLPLKQLKTLNRNLVDNLVKRHKFTFKKDILKYYKMARDKLLKKLHRKLDFTARDEVAVRLLRESKVLTKIYKNMSERLSSKINTTITEAIKKGAIDFNKLVGSIHKIQRQEYSAGDKIARTEHSCITNIASANTYDQLDKEAEIEGLYRWFGPDDIRTSEYCKRICKLTKDGVTLKELEKIITKYGDTRLKYRRPFQAHIRCRHTIQPI